MLASAFSSRLVWPVSLCLGWPVAPQRFPAPRFHAMPPAAFVPSPEQKSVISYLDGHLQVIACAGSGKTEAISRRVAALIEEDVEPGQIVAFTFTERAAASLKTRITKRIAECKGEAFLDRL